MDQDRYRQIYEEKALMSGGLRLGGCEGSGYQRCAKSGRQSKVCDGAKNNLWLQFIHEAALMNPNKSRAEILHQFGEKGDQHNSYLKWKKDREAWGTNAPRLPVSTKHYAKPKSAKPKYNKPKVPKSGKLKAPKVDKVVFA